MREMLRVKLARIVEEVVRRELRTVVDELKHELTELTHELKHQLHAMEVRDRRDLFAAGERDAVMASARFVRTEMPTATRLDHPRATLRHALTLAPADGMALEFGVYTGTTLEAIAAARGGREVYGFDSFKGLPEVWRPGYPAASFDAGGIPDVPGAELVIGWFEDTLSGFLAEHPGPVALLHIDCDLYSSARTVLTAVGPRLQPGSIVVFDEYFNYPGWEDHEHRAWREFVKDSGVEFNYEAFTLDNEQVVVRITSV